MEGSTAGADLGTVGRHINSWGSALGEIQQPSLHALRARRQAVTRKDTAARRSDMPCQS